MECVFFVEYLLSFRESLLLGYEDSGVDDLVITPTSAAKSLLVGVWHLPQLRVRLFEDVAEDVVTQLVWDAEER